VIEGCQVSQNLAGDVDAGPSVKNALPHDEIVVVQTRVLVDGVDHEMLQIRENLIAGEFEVLKVRALVTPEAADERSEFLTFLGLLEKRERSPLGFVSFFGRRETHLLFVDAGDLRAELVFEALSGCERLRHLLQEHETVDIAHSERSGLRRRHPYRETRESRHRGGREDAPKRERKDTGCRGKAEHGAGSQ
jgi:hypothetical protein